MSVRIAIYNQLVNRVPGIRDRYQKKRYSSDSKVGRVSAWASLAGMNISYYLLRNKSLQEPEKYPMVEFKNLYTEDSESSLSVLESPEDYAQKLMRYDVISFDVFDTLILRPLSDPKDLFYFVGQKLNYPNFKWVRTRMEEAARQKKYREFRTYEVTLKDIYFLMQHEAGIDAGEGMRTEIRTEVEFCRANPYMKKVVEALADSGKDIIITSDMYLSEQMIRDILRNAGYPDFKKYYISCEHRESKSDGKLFETVKKDFPDKEIIHIGDNYFSDYEMAEKHGFSTRRYCNVNWTGMKYRAEDMSSITGSLYRGLVNSHIHNGLKKYSRYYEYGYIYGGLFVTGYCQFIHKYVHSHNIDKILFLARDGYVLSRAYHMLYPDEDDTWEYVYWSRLAGTKMTADHFRYDYLQRFIYHKINQGNTIGSVMKSMELEDMMPQLVIETRLRAGDILTDRNAGTVKEFCLLHWEKLLAHYDEQILAGGEYYREILAGCHNAAAVDIGWAGSGATQLNYLVNEVWNLNCSITGLLGGTSTCHLPDGDMSEPFLEDGRLVSYMYSQRDNRDIWKQHDPNAGHNLYWEIFLDAPMGSFKGFYRNKDGTIDIRLKDSNTDIRRMEQIQNGLYEFLQEWMDLPVSVDIGGRDAYAAMRLLLSGTDKSYGKFLDSLLDQINI